uniref:AGA2 n=1 Tax=Arundo donax TaxID=35708 RepID=A0A0A9FBF4_ARUDO
MNRTPLRAPRETTWRAAGSAKSAPMKTPSTAPPAAADDATTTSGTPDSTVRPQTDSVPPASLTDEAIVIFSPSLSSSLSL